MNEFMTKLRGKKKKVYKRWKQKQVSQEEYTVTIWTHKDADSKVKAHLMMNLTRDRKGNKKGLYKYDSNKRSKENMVSLLNVAEDLLTKDTEKANLLSGFFASLFVRLSFRNLRSWDHRESLEKERLILVGRGSGLGNWTHEYMGSDGIHTGGESGGWHHCEAACNNNWKEMGTGRSFWGLEQVPLLFSRRTRMG